MAFACNCQEESRRSRCWPHRLSGRNVWIQAESAKVFPNRFFFRGKRSISQRSRVKRAPYEGKAQKKRPEWNEDLIKEERGHLSEVPLSEIDTWLSSVNRWCSDARAWSLGECFHRSISMPFRTANPCRSSTWTLNLWFCVPPRSPSGRRSACSGP